MQVRPLHPGWLGEVARIEALAYPQGLSEPPETFGKKLELFPRGALGAFRAEALGIEHALAQDNKGEEQEGAELLPAGGQAA